MAGREAGPAWARAGPRTPALATCGGVARSHSASLDVAGSRWAPLDDVRRRRSLGGVALPASA